MNHPDAPPPPYSFTPPPNQGQRQPPVAVANPQQQDSNVPPPLPSRTPSFATTNTSASSLARSRQTSEASPGGSYSYSTGIIYPPPSPRQDTYNSPDTARQVRFADNQQAESECYLYPGSYRDPIDPRDLQEKVEKKWSPPLPPRPLAATATRGEHFAQPVAKRPMAPPSTRLDPVVGTKAGTGVIGGGAAPAGMYGTGTMDPTYDTRTLSTQSIVTTLPSPAPFGLKRRKLLLIYIHGFLGSTTSFNQFPQHLHTLLTCLLSTSCPQYTVHTKLYPRFKTRHAIGDAAEMFSQWLSEFEDEDEVPGRKALRSAGQEPPQEKTDIILLGHSMGGLLAGEVVLLPRLHPTDNDPRRYRHRILGLVGFDVPFLGMHPGIVASGLSSLFRPSPKPDKRKETGPMSQTASNEGPSAEDLFLRKNPEHFDTGLAPKSDSGNRGIRNFLTKYSGNLPGATMQYLMSHMEFAGCLADPMGLLARYRRLRGLEDGRDLSTPGGDTGVGGYRVRFVNYYTVCNGRDKDKEKEREKDRDEAMGALTKINTEIAQNQEINPPQLKSHISNSQHKRGISAASTGTVTSISSNATTDEKNLDINGVSPPSSPGVDSPRSSTSTPPPLPPPHIIPVSPRVQSEKIPPLPQSPQRAESSQDPLAILNARSQRYSLPPIPPPPVAPPLHKEEDLSHIKDQTLQKVHMKENKRIWKEHWRREKVHAKLIKEREKVLAKLEGKVAEISRPPTVKEKGPGAAEAERAEKLRKKEKAKKEKERKFCLIPKEAKGGDGVGENVVDAGGARDETWVKVPMGNVDEVGAHCGLFMAGAEIFESQSEIKPKQVGVAEDDSAMLGLMGADTGSEKQSLEIPRTSVVDDDERKELDAKRRQYERLVGDLAERIEGWVKEHVGSLQAFEIAGQQMIQEKK